VQAAANANPVLVVGMAGNPHCRRARQSLDGAGVPHQYLEFGSYFSQWRRRNALKMWTGWPTFPMVFVKGALVGGAQDLKKLVDSGELKRLLGES
jgi:glutaredoxin-related protein